MTITLNNLTPAAFTPGRSATGGDTAPPRPAACTNPATEIAGFADAQARIARATAAVFDLQHDLRVARLAVASLDEQRAALISKVQAGNRVAGSEAGRIDIERAAATATLTLTAEALDRAENDVRAARTHLRTVLRAAADDYLALLREGAAEASAEARAARRKEAAFEGWTRDVQVMLQHALETDDLTRLLGLP